MQQTQMRHRTRQQVMPQELRAKLAELPARKQKQRAQQLLQVKHFSLQLRSKNRSLAHRQTAQLRRQIRMTTLWPLPLSEGPHLLPLLRLLWRQQRRTQNPEVGEANL